MLDRTEWSANYGVLGWFQHSISETLSLSVQWHVGNVDGISPTGESRGMHRSSSKAQTKMANSNSISDHFNGRRFHNPKPRSQGFRALLRWLSNRQQGEWKPNLRATFGPKPLAVVPGIGDEPDELRITFVNHSTFLIQCFGVNVLTDPIWSERASPFTWMGPKRMRPPGIRIDDLPRIHCVLLSHDHYDHMDVPTLRHLWKMHRPTFYTGLGNRRRLRGLGIDRVEELDWWDSVAMPGGLRLTATPAQHFSGRTPFDRDTTLWCSFMIEPPSEFAASGSIYFGADTGFGPHFEKIAHRFPSIRTAILPIGAYRPEWFMGEVHCSPSESVEAHRVLRSQLSIACHFGTFPLADDGEVEAEEELKRALMAKPVEGEFVVPQFGEALEIDALATERETMSGTED
jgi:L-ascorbate metabolism protein UlaG (beta-lactamase superfamily)